MGTDPNLKFIKEAFESIWSRPTDCLKVSEQYPVAFDQVLDAIKNIKIMDTIRSDKDTQSPFNQAISVNALSNGDMNGLVSNKIIIRRIKMQMDVARNWRLILWKTDTFDDADLDLDSFCGVVNVATSDMWQIGGANQYYWDSGELYIPYEDLDGTFELHVGLVNLGPSTKVAGSSDEMIAEFEYEVMA